MTSPRPVARFQSNFTEVFPYAFTKIANMVPLEWTKWPPELNIEKPLSDIFSLAMTQFQKDFTEMFHLSSFTKIAKCFLSAEQNGRQS